jgi:hypothetical protein
VVAIRSYQYKDTTKEANTTLQQVSVEEILALQINEQVRQEKTEARRHKYMLEHGYMVNIAYTIPFSNIYQA